MSRQVSSQDILDAALHCAAERHWEKVRLADVAAALGVPLAALHAQIPDKEAIVDLLWDRSDDALLAHAHSIDALADVPARMEALVLAWLAPLAPHRRVVREMLLVRLEPGHLHIQLPTLIRISRSVQWLREATGLRAAFGWRALEEVALSALFVATVAAWLHGGDEGAARDILRRGLRAGDAIRTRLGPRNDIH